MAGALHEVSNALTVVLGWVALARERSTEPAVLEALHIAETHAELGRRLARAGIGAAPLPEREREVEVLLADAAAAAAPEAARKGVELQVQPEGVDGLLVPEPSAALEILINLLFNAIAFSPESATVLLGASARGDAQVRFHVADEGPGIEAERWETLLHAPQSTRDGGTGIGLPHSRRVAESNGGELGICEVERGSCFELFWPVTMVQSGARLLRPEATNLNGLCIAVLDDDSNVRSLLELGLAARGASVTGAEHLTELERIQACDLLLVDLSPIADNPRAVLEAFVARRPAAKIVLISGRPEGMPEGLGDLVCGELRKPFEVGEVAELIQRILAGA